MYRIKFLDENNKQKIEIKNLSCADNFFKRLLGLMGKNKFGGIIFKQNYSNILSGSIHTFFMKVPIDILYINNEMFIQEIITLKTWKLYIPKKGNIKYIIELPENTIYKHNIHTNDKVVIRHEKKKN